MINYHKISPYIRVAMDNTITPPWNLGKRVILDYEIQYIKSGRIEVNMNNTTYIGEPGDIFIYKPNEAHDMKLIGSEPLRQPHLHFDLVYEDNSPEVKVTFKPFEELADREKALIRPSTDFQLPSHIRLSSPDTFENKLFLIIQEYNKKLPYYELKVKSLFIDLWTYLLREAYRLENPQMASHEEQLRKVKSYIDENFDKKIALDNLSKAFYINKYHLIRLFKEYYGMTPIQYHGMIRLSKAKELIQFSDMTLSEIAYELGYSSLHALSRAFKNHENVSPSYYRQKNRL